MSRKPGTVSEETRARLLEAAAKEFSNIGYQKASLRTICSKAGVTTGALYFFFKGKDDLLQQVIAPLCDEVKDYLDAWFGAGALENGRGFLADEETEIASVEELCELIRRESVVASIILKNREHEAVQAFFADIVAIREENLAAVVERLHPELVDSPCCDRRTLHWLARVQVDAFLGLYCGESDDVQAKTQVNLLVRSFRRGLADILEENG